MQEVETNSEPLSGSAGVSPNAVYFLLLRPEGPEVSRPERQLGVGSVDK
jgi:hypothetical protein